MNDANMATEFALERRCVFCNGEGGAGPSELCDRFLSCTRCHGSGHLPTETGKKILALMRHNFRAMLESAQAE
jgi:hypothetical protein